jgi:hypothetical protein
MMHNIPVLTISYDFIIEDSRKISKWHYKHLKNVIVQERTEKIRRQIEHDIRAAERIRAEKEVHHHV